MIHNVNEKGFKLDILFYYLFKKNIYLNKTNVELNIVWNGLREVYKKQLFVIPWNRDSNESYFLWINLTKSSTGFSADAFLQENLILSDSKGRNSIVTYKNINKIFVLTSSMSTNQVLWVAAFNYTSFGPKGIIMHSIDYFGSGDFLPKPINESIFL